jgi:hypothetical protein
MTENVTRLTFGVKRPIEKLKTQPGRVTPIAQQAKEPTEQDVGSLVGEALAMAQRDLKYMIANSDHAHVAIAKINEITRHVFGLENFSPHDVSVELRRRGLRSTSLKELCVLAQRSKRGQWSNQPFYFCALALEYNSRVERAKSLLPKE